MIELGREFYAIWAKGGWLMLPLFALTVFIYYATLELLLRLNGHFLIRYRCHEFSDTRIEEELKNSQSPLCEVVPQHHCTALEARRHFQETRSEYLPVVSRRIRFLAILITTGPLVGLLGTVTGMLTTFDGMAGSADTKFQSVVSGVSEALITTQAGLIISIPAYVILSLIVQRRNRLERCIARLEQFSVRKAIRSERRFEDFGTGCPLAMEAVK